MKYQIILDKLIKEKILLSHIGEMIESQLHM